MIRIKITGTILILFSILLFIFMSYSFIAPNGIAFEIVRVILWIYTILFSIFVGWIGLILLRSKEPLPVEQLKKEIEQEVERIRREAIEAAMKSGREDNEK
ncbi:hypothetical protein IPA_04320 [Ignicoccus pacificus DSM 13166]|uniref:Uncharacterized protein n=1 Tax=Ignicoccus pacificus DSM 13166 TaxID=940294 RepID=A0A977PK29_9CREN|nr:hypothetical protein IPA_04320 [Ignicoccus pacificus DSM 13166]